MGFAIGQRGRGANLIVAPRIELPLPLVEPASVAGAVIEFPLEAPAGAARGSAEGRETAGHGHGHGSSSIKFQQARECDGS